VLFYGSEGYVVCPSYDGGSVFDLQGNMVKSFGQGGGDDNHFANFLAAVRSRKHEELNADIQEGHLSSALCHLGNISYRLGEPLNVAEVTSRLEGPAFNDESRETFDRFRQHLEANGVSLDKTPVQFGRQLQLNDSESFVGDTEADAMLTREYRAPFVVPSAGQV
jgi:hypothetical protein